MKYYLFVFMSAALAGCGGPAATPPQPPGYYQAASHDEDFALNCDEIWRRSENAKRQISHARHWLKRQNDPQRQKDIIRDYGSRLRVLHKMSKQKDCFEQWGETPAEPEQQAAPAPQQPAPREKSRVIICADDKTCIVE